MIPSGGKQKSTKLGQYIGLIALMALRFLNITKKPFFLQFCLLKTSNLGQL